MNKMQNIYRLKRISQEIVSRIFRLMEMSTRTILFVYKSNLLK